MSDSDLTALFATVADVREWAAANGRPVGARGRIAREVLEAFTAATGRVAIQKSGKGIIA